MDRSDLKRLPKAALIAMLEKYQGRDDDFGAVLNCAVRYCLGRRTYMPQLVTGYIVPLLPCLSYRTLAVFLQDIDSADDLGDPNIDEPKWKCFRASVAAQMEKTKVRK